MHTVLGISLEIVVVLLLVVANGFFVAAEFALVKVRTSQLQPMAKTGGWRVRFALKATKHLDAALSATQLGVTLASLGLGWVGEPFLAHRLEPLLARWGVTDDAAVSSIAFGVAFGVITFLHITFGELAPKSLAIQRSKGVSLAVSVPLILFYYFFYPVIWLLNGASNLVLRWAGLKPTSEGDSGFNPDELEYVLSHARHSHPGEALVNRLMVQSLRLRKTRALHIMRPREQVVALWLDRSVTENLQIAQRSGHSRFPVCRGSLDRVEGVLVIREWLWELQRRGPETPFDSLIRPALFVETTAPVHDLMETLRAQRNYLAVVRDDHQRMAGVVTFEDVLEEIVGDIRDELDRGAGPIFERTESALVVGAEFTVRELQAETGWPLEWQPRETIGAWMCRHLGHVPRKGESTRVGELRLTALEATPERPRRVRIERGGEGARSAEV